MENSNFKLSTIPYERSSMEDFNKEAEKIVQAFKSATSGEEQFEVHKKYYTLLDKYYKNNILAIIRHDADVSDKFYEEEQNYYDKVSPNVTNFETKYKKLLYNSPYRDYLEKKIGKVAFKNIELKIKSFDECLIPLKQEENALMSEYGKLIASIKVEFRGDTLNLSLLGKYTKSADRNTRIEACKVRSDKLSTIKGKLDDIYSKLVENRTKQAKLMGYEDYVELGYYNMQRNSYGRCEVKAFRDDVKKYLVPLVSKIHENRRKRLGLDELNYIDEPIYFKEGNPKPVGTAEDIFESGKKMYSELSKETEEFFNFMLDHELFDVLGRPNKALTGYMTMIPEVNVPMIFANFNGTNGDVGVLTHESGHAFQGYLTRDYEIKEHNDITCEIAEVHSMSMEFFTSKWMELFFKDRADDFRTMQFEDALAFIPYGCMVDEFQEIIYSKPTLTAEERNSVWQGLEKEYKPHLKFFNDGFFEEGRTWQLQGHIYQSPFYYIDYCFAEVAALQFKINMDKDYKNAWDKYLRFALESAKDYFPNMLREAGLKSPFDKNFVKDLVEELENL